MLSGVYSKLKLSLCSHRSLCTFVRSLSKSRGAAGPVLASRSPLRHGRPLARRTAGEQSVQLAACIMAVAGVVACRRATSLTFRMDFAKLCTNGCNSWTLSASSGRINATDNNGAISFSSVTDNCTRLGLRQCRRRFATLAGGGGLSGSRRAQQMKFAKLQQQTNNSHDTYNNNNNERRNLSLGAGTTTRSSSSSSDSDSTDTDEDDVTVEYARGLPQLTVPLPSRKERCRFTLKPISNTVGDFIAMLKTEDKGIDRVTTSTLDGTRIASSNTIEHLLEEDFRLTINDRAYKVRPPKRERLTNEASQQLNDVKNMISQLYEALNVQDHHIGKERELTTEIETLKQELQPLEDIRGQIEVVAQRKGNWLAWAGLGLMSVQFGILARLTWWEYSWDIMEPVTYFVTYGTAMACYAYYVLTKEEYILTDVRDRQQLFVVHKRAKKLGLDLTKYNQLKEQVTTLEKDLKRLKDPLRANLPRKSAATVAAVSADGTMDATTAANEELVDPVKSGKK